MISLKFKALLQNYAKEKRIERSTQPEKPEDGFCLTGFPPCRRELSKMSHQKLHAGDS